MRVRRDRLRDDEPLLLARSAAFGAVVTAGGGFLRRADVAERLRGAAVSGAQPRIHGDLFREALRIFQRFDGEIDVKGVPINAPAIRSHVAQFHGVAVFEPGEIGVAQEILLAVDQDRDPLG